MAIPVRSQIYRNKVDILPKYPFKIVITHQQRPSGRKILSVLNRVPRNGRGWYMKLLHILQSWRERKSIILPDYPTYRMAGVHTGNSWPGSPTRLYAFLTSSSDFLN